MQCHAVSSFYLSEMNMSDAAMKIVVRRSHHSDQNQGIEIKITWFLKRIYV